MSWRHLLCFYRNSRRRRPRLYYQCPPAAVFNILVENRNRWVPFAEAPVPLTLALRHLRCIDNPKLLVFSVGTLCIIIIIIIGDLDIYLLVSIGSTYRLDCCFSLFHITVPTRRRH